MRSRETSALEDRVRLASIRGNPDTALGAMPPGPATTMDRLWCMAQAITGQVLITAAAGAGAATGGETRAQGRSGFTNPSCAGRDRFRYESLRLPTPALAPCEEGRFLMILPNYTLKLLVRNPSPRHYPSNWTMRVGRSGCQNRTCGPLGESLIKTACTVPKCSRARS